MRRILAALLLTTTPALAEMPPGISHFTLDNGMEAVVIEDHRAPVVVQMVWYRIGSADEVPGKTGLAHYLEHLMFKGTETLAPGELSKTVTANGGMDNAFTSYDFTAYFQRIASDRLHLVMKMEADRMQNLRIGEDDWQAERQVVLEERAQRTDSDPRALFAEERSAVQFYNHPYGRPVIGWRDEMMGLTREDAMAWYDAHYAPNAAILIVAGDVTADQVKKLAEEYYGPIPPKPEAVRAPRPQEPTQRAAREISLRDPRIPQPSLSRSVIVPERNPGDQKQAAALTVLAELLGGSPQTSVLGRQLVLTGKALWAGASYDGLSVDPTTFSVSMAYPPGTDPATAEAELNATLDAFLTDGPDPAQLDRVKTQLRAARIYERDSAHGRAYDYGQGLAVGLTVEDVNDWPDLLADVTVEDVKAAAALALTTQGAVTSHLLPAEAAVGAAMLDAAPQTVPPTTAEQGGTADAAPADAVTPDAASDGATAAPANTASTTAPNRVTTPDAGTAAPRPADTPDPATAPPAPDATPDGTAAPADAPPLADPAHPSPAPTVPEQPANTAHPAPAAAPATEPKP